MITNARIFKIYAREIITFRKESRFIVVDGEVEYQIKSNRFILLGIISDKLVVSIKNKYIISLNFPSFTLHRVLYKGALDAFTSSPSCVWFQEENEVFHINSDMQVSFYDDFKHVHLLNIVYLHELATLAFIVKEREETKIHFETSSVPTLIFSEISSIPEISFESSTSIFISIGRSVFEYDVEQKKLKIVRIENQINIDWKFYRIKIDYRILKTNIAIFFNGEEIKAFEIEGDVWKVLNAGHTLYLFSDSINRSISIHKIDAHGGCFEIYSDKKNSYLVELDYAEEEERKQYPLLKFYGSCNDKAVALFFIHGGPHQKAGNLWDPLLLAALQNDYCIYVPQYPGTDGVGNSEDGSVPCYGIDDFQDVLLHYNRIKQAHEKVIVLGHSYGAFLALKLFFHTDVDLLIGINGVYDLLTISLLNPKTYAHLDEKTKIERSPQQSSVRSGEWHHIQFKHDPLIKLTDLENSINKIGGKGPKIHYLNLYGHGTFNGSQSSHIVELIKLIEYQVYKKPLSARSYEQKYC